MWSMRKLCAAAFLLATGFTFSVTGLARQDENWDPALAARYLDARQEAWFAWPRSAARAFPQDLLSGG